MSFVDPSNSKNEVTNRWLMECGSFKENGKRYVQSCLEKNDLIAYDEFWMVGRYFFMYFCVHLDYELNEFGIAIALDRPHMPRPVG